jgi:hypothetical protein
VAVAVKSLACELPSRLGVPLSRFHVPGLREVAIERGIVAGISGKTIWRWLAEDAIRPWRHRSWIFPHDPGFEAKAGRVLDLYAREWESKPLGEGDFVISSGEKTSIQARVRCHQSLAPAPRRAMRAGHEYERAGALQYLAAWDVHRAKIFGRCEPATGIEPFRRLVSQVMDIEPCASARRVFWVVDNGSSHRGDAACQRLTKRWPNARLVQLPIHASWLNQVFFSVLQRKVLTPSDFADLGEVESAWRPSSAATSTPPSPSSGSSPATTSPNSSRSLPASRTIPRRDDRPWAGGYVIEIMPPSTTARHPPRTHPA